MPSASEERMRSTREGYLGRNAQSWPLSTRVKPNGVACKSSAPFTGVGEREREEDGDTPASSLLRRPHKKHQK